MSKYNEIYEKYAKKHFSQLIGYKILCAFKLEEWYENEYVPVLLVKKGNQAFQVAISQDEEGNGGGHLFIEDFKTD